MYPTRVLMSRTPLIHFRHGVRGESEETSSSAPAASVSSGLPSTTYVERNDPVGWSVTVVRETTGHFGHAVFEGSQGVAYADLDMLLYDTK